MKKYKRILYLFNISLFILFSEIFGQANPKEINNDWDVFPILNYDTDVGFGYGLKGFFYNYLEGEESFDITAYNSTKGERWYQFVFSSPDMLRRQGKKYNMAIDFIIDYDKYINFNYYSDKTDDFVYFFNDTLVKKSEQYVREPIEIKLLFSKAFTNDFISEGGLQFRNISCYNFESEGILQFKLPSEVRHISLLFNFRIDTRDNFINPQKGVVAQINNEYAIDTKGNGNNFYRIDLIFQSYLNIFRPYVTFASRIKLQGLLGLDIYNNYQNLLYLGGNNSLRGLPQSKYLSNSTILLNEEIRFPIWWKFGAIVGVDLGNSTSTPDWIVNPVIGLRFYLDNFIVRFDVGFDKDNLGIYFNFGHLF